MKSNSTKPSNEYKLEVAKLVRIKYKLKENGITQMVDLGTYSLVWFEGCMKFREMFIETIGASVAQLIPNVGDEVTKLFLPTVVKKKAEYKEVKESLLRINLRETNRFVERAGQIKMEKRSLPDERNFLKKLELEKEKIISTYEAFFCFKDDELPLCDQYPDEYGSAIDGDELLTKVFEDMSSNVFHDVMAYILEIRERRSEWAKEREQERAKETESQRAMRLEHDRMNEFTRM